MSRSSSSSTITLVPTTPPPGKQYFEQVSTTDLSLPSRPCLDLSAVKVTKPIKALLSSALTALDSPLRIVGLLATADSGCHMYADMTARACKTSNVHFDKLDISSDLGEDAFQRVRSEILSINKDTTVDGLIVYFPLFTPERDAALRALISPRIDVEGIHPTSLQRSSSHAPDTIEDLTSKPGNADIYPCTALAIIRVLQSPEAGVYSSSRTRGERFRGRTVTIINRSETVGRPLAGMLANDGARVYSVDIDSIHTYERSESKLTITPTHASLPELLTVSDVVVTAVPGKYKVPTQHLAEGAVCVDVSEMGNFEEDVRDRAGVYAPRIGSVTILMLMLNALVLRATR